MEGIVSSVHARAGHANSSGLSTCTCVRTRDASTESSSGSSVATPANTRTKASLSTAVGNRSCRGSRIPVVTSKATAERLVLLFERVTDEGTVAVAGAELVDVVVVSVEVGVSNGGGTLFVILTGIGRLVFEDLDELEESGCDAGTKDGSEPVDPVVAFELVVVDGRAEGSSGVEGATGEEDTCRYLSAIAKVDLIARRDVPVSSAMKSERPIPTGAMKVPLCFSAANMKIVKTS